jgi:hypothetical protein
MLARIREAGTTASALKASPPRSRRGLLVRRGTSVESMSLPRFRRSGRPIPLHYNFTRGLPIKSRLPRSTPFQRRMS